MFTVLIGDTEAREGNAGLRRLTYLARRLDDRVTEGDRLAWRSRTASVPDELGVPEKLWWLSDP